MKKIELFERHEDCCACGACLNSCPRQAITMQKDERGFLYPKIEEDKCIDCGLCREVCRFTQKTERLPSTAAYAVQAKEDVLLGRSASGGVFAMLAREIVQKGGVAVGCALTHDGKGLVPHHIPITTVSELDKLQGSKYVQSHTDDIFCQVKRFLDEGKEVLFSGTPCQVDGLYGFLRGKEYPGLQTVDLICHGTPSAAMFADYLQCLEKRAGGAVVDFQFRDKSQGWGLNGRYTYMAEDGSKTLCTFPAQKSSYYALFLAGEIYRDSCYVCKYACQTRPGDLTIGDFWGIHNQHPAVISSNGGPLFEEKGISCVLVNTEKGQTLVNRMAEYATIIPTKIEHIAVENRQLNNPATHSKDRAKFLALYRDKGYAAMEKWFVRRRFFKKCMHKIWRLVTHGFSKNKVL